MVNPNWPTVVHSADWVHGPNDGVQSWTGLEPSTTVETFKIRRGRQFELDQIEVGTADYGIVDKNELLNPANTSSAWNSSGNSLKPYRQIQTIATWASVPYPLFGGYVERYDVGWDMNGWRGRRDLACVDAMAMLNRPTMRSIVDATYLALAPSHYWPLADTALTSPTDLVITNPTAWTSFTQPGNTITPGGGPLPPLGEGGGSITFANTAGVTALGGTLTAPAVALTTAGA